MRVAPEIILSDREKRTLEKLSRSNTTSVRLARRAKIVLLAAAGLENQEIAAHFNTGRVHMSLSSTLRRGRPRSHWKRSAA